jgi:hypothetical protein
MKQIGIELGNLGFEAGEVNEGSGLGFSCHKNHETVRELRIRLQTIMVI